MTDSPTSTIVAGKLAMAVLDRAVYRVRYLFGGEKQVHVLFPLSHVDSIEI